MKKVKRIFLLAVIMVNILMFSMNAYASENKDIQEVKATKKTIDMQLEQSDRASVVSLGSCGLGISIQNNGVGLSYFTSATVNATEIGIRDFKLYEKALIGWRELSLSNYYSYNTDYHSGTIVYTGAVAGKRYKASCTHYAKINGVEYTLGSESSEITYN